MTSNPSRRRLRIADALSLGAIALTACASTVVYPRLPARVATHFDLAGNANAWSSRVTGAYLLLGVGVATWLFVRFGAYLLPASWRARYAASPMAEVACAVLLLMMGLHVLILRAALQGKPHLGTSVAGLIGVTWLGLAAFIPRVRRNPFVGIRTPWTLVSDENWARTHRFGSYTFAVGGVLALVAAVRGGSRAVPFALAMMVITMLVPAVYSWRLARRSE